MTQSKSLDCRDRFVEVFTKKYSTPVNFRLLNISKVPWSLIASCEDVPKESAHQIEASKILQEHHKKKDLVPNGP